MIDRSYGDFGRFLRTPDLKLSDVRTETITASAGYCGLFSFPGRGVLAHAFEGAWQFSLEKDWIDTAAGTTVGFESGRPHRWRSKDGGKLVISSIPRQMSVLQSLSEGTIIIPHDAEPYASIIRHAVHLHLIELETNRDLSDQAIVRRCAEICMIELVRFVRDGMSASGDAPEALMHDEYLLRVWAVFYADPRKKWTVQKLADAAGLGRSAFLDRFKRVFGSSPLHTLTRLRLEQAEELLLHTNVPLIEIAFRAGYNSEAAFVRAFQRHFKCTPGRFRKHAQ